MTGVVNIFSGAFVASIAWFILGGILYMNPIVAKIYKGCSADPGMKSWPDQKKYMFSMYLLGGFVPILLIALLYVYIKPILPCTLSGQAAGLGTIIIGVRIVPRLFDMWLQSSYPERLLFIEFVNGSLLSFAIAFVLALML